MRLDRQTIAQVRDGDRQTIARVREDRAAAHEAMADVLSRSQNGRMSAADVEIFDRHERKFDELDGVLAEYEGHRSGGPTEGDREARLAARECSHLAGGRGVLDAAAHAANGASRRASPYLTSERRMADVVIEQRNYGREEQAEAPEFNVGAMLRSMLTGEGAAADSPERRAILGNTDANGAVMLPELVGAGLIDALLPQTVVHEAGALAYPMKAGKETLPGIDTLPTPGWRGWGDDVAESDPTFRGVELNAKTLAVRFSVPVEFIEDVSREANLGIEQTLVQALALEVDRAAMLGTGEDNQPQGLYGTDGVNETALGATPESWASLLAAYFAVRKRNAKPSAFVMSERDQETHAGLTATDGQPLRLPPAIENIPQLSTTSVPSDLGTGTDEGLIFTGQWDQLVVGYRPTVGVRVLRTLDPNTLTNTVVAFVRADVGVLRPAAFEVVSGVLPPA